jgi:hypothetical protein
MRASIARTTGVVHFMKWYFSLDGRVHMRLRQAGRREAECTIAEALAHPPKILQGYWRPKAETKGNFKREEVR